ncbi:hypothetical protein VAS14_11654 [Photobacterium angustum S14]|uniref:OmpR/PhoB-type domain-containing protein n=2 Tax=Photobacterium angustum TaxID=661 RepID=Q1ZVU4_PHOAS|nr:hypothetical protein VAS14_11654 [Photobacterium angustum S14]
MVFMSTNYQINHVKFDSKKGLLSDSCQQHLLTYTESRLLTLLLERQNEIVSKEELKTFAWEHTVVTDSSLTKSIAKIRQSLSTYFPNDEIIATVPRVGYRLDLEKTSFSEDKLEHEVETSTVLPSENNVGYQAQKLPFKKSFFIIKRGLLVLSIALLAYSGFNLFRKLPNDYRKFLNNDYSAIDITNNGFTHRIIKPKSFIIPEKIKAILAEKKCNCIFMIDKVGDHYNFSYFNNDTKLGGSLILDEKHLTQELKKIDIEEI